MHNATLDQGVRIDTLDGILEAWKHVDAEEQNVFYTTSLDILKYQAPLPGTLTIVQIQTQNVALAICRNSINRINSLTDYLAVLPKLIMNRIKINDWKAGRQRTLLPLNNLVPNAIGNGTDGTHTHLNPVQFHELVANILNRLTTV
jgi:hypothetical protein